MAGSITVRELLTVLGVDAETPKVQQFDKAMVQTTKSMGQAVQGTRDLTAGVGRLVGAYLGLGALKQAGKGIFDANVEFERLEARLTTVTGSSEKAAEAFEQIKTFAATTPFELGEVTKAYIGLTRKGLDTSAESMTALGDLASANGQTIERAFEGISSAVTKSDTSILESVAGIDFAVKGNQLMAKMADGTTKTMKKETKAVYEFLVAMGKMPGVAGGMAKQMETLGGKATNLKDVIFQLQVEIGQAGLSDALQELLLLLIKIVSGSNVAAASLGRALATGVRTLTKAIQFLVDHMQEAKLVLGALAAAFAVQRLAAFTSSMGGVLQAIRALGVAATLPALKLAAIAAAILLVVLVANDLVVFMRGGDSVIGRFLGKFEGTEGTMGKIADALRNLINQGMALFQQAVPMITSLLAQAGGKAMEMATRIIPVVFQIVEAILPIVEQLFSIWMELQTTWWGLTVQIFEQLAPFILQIVQLLAGFVAQFFPLILDTIQMLMPMIGEIVSLVIGGLAEIMPMLLELVGVGLDMLVELWPLINEILALILPMVMDLIRALMPIIVFIVKLVITNLEWMVKVSGFVLKMLLTILIPIIKAIIDYIMMVVDTVVTVVGFILDLWTFFSDLFVSIWEAVKDPILSIWDTIKGAVISILTFLAELFNTVIESIIGVVNSLIEAYNEVAETLGIATISTFSAEELTFSVPEQEPPKQTMVDKVEVTIQGSTGMGPDQVSRATQDGVNRSLREADRAAG